jgi:teichuronic acid biosynthesis glycosyltransferase TuaG
MTRMKYQYVARDMSNITPSAAEAAARKVPAAAVEIAPDTVDISSLSHLVSVITPAYNEAPCLRRVVESVANQTVPVYEHIIINDGSRDNSEEILQELEAEYPHLIVINKKRGGAAAARNVGIELAKGRYIAFLDADDLWLSHKVENQIGFMEKHHYLFSYGDYDETGKHFNKVRIKKYVLPPKLGHKQLLHGCPIGCLTVAYNQEKLGKHYLPNVKSGHDWGLWLEITRSGVCAYKYPGVEAEYTNGRFSLSSRKFKKVKNIYRLYRTSEKLSAPRSVFETFLHVAMAVAKKIRLIYK